MAVFSYPAARHLLLLTAALFLLVASFAGSARAQTSGVAVRTCSGGSISLSRYEAGVLRLQNRIRADHGLKRLCLNPILERAARSHSREMLQKQYFSHDSYNGQSFSDRLIGFGYIPKGYRHWTVGENIAWGSGSSGRPASIVGAWMHSPEHRANILDRSYREVGIGVAGGTFGGNDNSSLYTVDFGARTR